MIIANRYRRTICALAVIGFTICAWTNPALAIDAPIARASDWFRYDPSVEEDWNFTISNEDPLRVTIRNRELFPGALTRRVLVLYPRRSSAYDIAISKILEVFDDKKMNVEFTVLNFRTDDARGRKALEYARQIKADLIYSMGSESTAWLHTNYRGGSIPVVSVCSKDPVLLDQMKNYESGSGTNFAYTSLNMPIDAQMAYVLDFKPNLRNFGILVSNDNVSAVETQARPIAEFAKQRGLQVLYLSVTRPETAKTELADLVKSAVATMRKSDPTLNNSLFWITGSTVVFNEIATINQHSDRVPVLSVVPEVVQAGDDSALLSIGISFESNAHLAAIYGAGILEGTKRASELPVGIVSPPDITINFRKAREIGLSVPFNFLERASVVFDYDGQIVRKNGEARQTATPAPTVR